MFSAGHLIWIAISAVLIVTGTCLCSRKRPEINRILTICLIIGIVSEVVKILSVVRILPMVAPVLRMEAGTPVLEYAETGQYTPYFELAHLPLELCSLQIVFIALALWAKDEKWKLRFLSILYPTGVLGGIMGILLAYVTADYTTVQSYFASPRIWQFFRYHSMEVTLGLYAGLGRDKAFSFREFKFVIEALIILDILSIYLNSVFSQPVYVAQKPVGVQYRTNFFSSYVNPIGLVLTEKWQWILYLLIRAALAVSLITGLFLLQRVVLCKPHESQESIS